MSKPDTGEPAYPEMIPKSDGLNTTRVYYKGMTLLDAAALKAMPEIQRQEPDAHRVAVLAYDQAEEMVKEKRQREA